MNQADLDLCYLSATEALARFVDHSLSPVELCQALIKRNEAVNPALNALTDCYFDEALSQARSAEGRYRNAKSGRARALEGLTVAVKDFHSVKGRLTTYGSKAYADFKPDNTAPTVERLLKAGAIMLSRTTTPEFAHAGITKSPLWGVTRNPWNTDCTPGGSSGGSAAVIAAGMATLADGTDGGGSCRIPAAFSGVVGYKPPFGRNPLDREHPLENLLHYGPITRSVADAALMQNVMSGQHVADQCSLREKVLLPDKFESIRGMKIAFSMDLDYFAIAPDVQKNTLETVRTLKRLGAKVEEVTLGWNYGVLDAWMTRWEGIFADIGGPLLPRWRYEMTPLCVRLIERGLSHSAARFYHTNVTRGDMFKGLGAVLERYDALVCPTLAVSSLPADHDDGGPDILIDGKPVPAYLGWTLTYPFNLMAWCPAMSVPSGFGAGDMPTALQVVGRTFDDPTVFRIASALEKARPWRERRPNI